MHKSYLVLSALTNTLVHYIDKVDIKEEIKWNYSFPYKGITATTDAKFWNIITCWWKENYPIKILRGRPFFFMGGYRYFCHPAFLFLEKLEPVFFFSLQRASCLFIFLYPKKIRPKSASCIFFLSKHCPDYFFLGLGRPAFFFKNINSST